jgi:hypothetical protein
MRAEPIEEKAIANDEENQHGLSGIPRTSKLEAPSEERHEKWHNCCQQEDQAQAQAKRDWA